MSFGAQPPFPDQATRCASGCRGPAGKLLELPHFSIVQMEPKYMVGFLKRVLRGDSCPNQQTVRVTQTGGGRDASWRRSSAFRMMSAAALV